MKMHIRFMAAALGLLVAAPAFATQSRINGLSGGEKSFTIRDEANIYGLPQFLVDHGNEVDVDATSGASYGRMNIRYALTDEAVLLLYGLRSPWQGNGAVTTVTTIGDKTPQAVAGVAAGQLAAADPTFHQFGLGFGLKVGEAMRLGARIELGGARADGDGNNLNSNTIFGLNFGLGFDLGETNALDFGISLRIGSFTDFEGGADRWVSESNLGFGLLGKGEFQVHQIAKLVPYLNLDWRGVTVGHAVRGDEVGIGNEAKKGTVTNTLFSLGADLAINPAERVLIQPGVGLGLRFSSAEGTAKEKGQILGEENSNLMMPFYGFAAEAQAFDWLALRVGARQTIMVSNNGNVAGQGQESTESHNSSVVNTVTTGLGISLRGWQIDLNLNPSFFNNGVFAVSGAPTSPYAFDFAIVYDW
jgi:hypothetical protein